MIIKITNIYSQIKICRFISISTSYFDELSESKLTINKTPLPDLFNLLFFLNIKSKRGASKFTAIINKINSCINSCMIKNKLKINKKKILIFFFISLFYIILINFKLFILNVMKKTEKFV